MELTRDFNAAVHFVDRHVVEGRGNKAAFIGHDRTLTYAQLRDAVSRVGPMLARLGVERENRVMMIMLDTVEFPIVFWGAIRAGIIPIPLNTRLTAEQFRYVIEDSRAKVLFVSEEMLDIAEQSAREVPTLKSIVVVGGKSTNRPRLDELLKLEQPAAPAKTCTDEVAFWLYSSGTTGMPKGVMHVHSSPLFAATYSGRGFLGVTQDDVILSVAKMSFSFGLGNAVTCPGLAGATSVLYPDRPTPQAIFELMARTRPTMLYAVPTFYAALLAEADVVARREGFDRLRMCVSAGEALPAHLGESWRKRFGLDIVNVVGSTEMAHFFIGNDPKAVEYGTSGRPLEGYEMRLVDERGRDVADGEIGELLVSGQSAANGYWNQREKTRHTFAGEWTRTGDKYVRRADGVYIYCGRTDDMFKVSGIWVSPFEVESALVTHPQVLEAAVVPAQDSDGLIKPKAFVVLKDRTQEPGRYAYEDLKAHVKREVGPWKYPRWIVFIDSLPKTATGKIQRYLLRED